MFNKVISKLKKRTETLECSFLRQNKRNNRWFTLHFLIRSSFLAPSARGQFFKGFEAGMSLKRSYVSKLDKVSCRN